VRTEELEYGNEKPAQEEELNASTEKRIGDYACEDGDGGEPYDRSNECDQEPDGETCHEERGDDAVLDEDVESEVELIESDENDYAVYESEWMKIATARWNVLHELSMKQFLVLSNKTNEEWDDFIKNEFESLERLADH
jgi:hypothetical protein